MLRTLLSVSYQSDDTSKLQDSASLSTIPICQSNILHQTISSRYCDIEVLGNASISTIFVSIKSYDTYITTIYREVSYASFDTRYIEVSRYHEVSVSNVNL